MSYVVSPAHIRLNRRWFLVAGGAALAAPALGRPVLAEATEAHRFTLGEVEVLVLSDGHLTLPASILAPSAPPEEFAALMTEIHGAVPETITPATNVVLIRTGDDLVLVDNGSGNKFQPTVGKLAENLAAAGVDPAAVTRVVFTHAHPDHVWGTLSDDGVARLPERRLLRRAGRVGLLDRPRPAGADARGPAAVRARRAARPRGGQGARHAAEGRRRRRARDQRDRHPGPYAGPPRRCSSKAERG